MRHLPIALGLVLGILTVPVRAQAPDTTSLRRATTAVVLDSTALRNGRGRTLADFLAGRVPGLLVTYESGQPSAAPRIVTRGSYGTLADIEPFLYVDGVLWRDDPDWFGAGRTWRLPSLGWQMPVDEIEEVRVHLGPVSGALLEFGASRGAVEVVTRRPRDGGVRLRANVQVSAMRYEPSPMRVESRAFASDPNFIGCTLGLAAEGQCVPGATFSLSAFDLVPLHGPARGLDAQVEGSGNVLGVRYRAGVTRGDVGGTLPSSDRSQTTLALSLDRPFGARWRATIDARAGSFAYGVADRGLHSLLRFPLSMRPDMPDTTVLYAGLMRDQALWQAPGRTGDRATLGGRLQYRLGEATRLELTTSLDRYWRGYQDSADLGSSTPALRRQRSRFELTNVHVALAGEHRRAFGPHVQVDLLARVGVTNSDVGERYRTEYYSDPFGWVSIAGDRRVDLRQASALGAVRVRVGDRLSVLGSVRHEEGKDVTLAPSLESFGGEYLLRRPASPDGLGLALVGGYGESIDHRTFGAKVEEWGRLSEAERTVEREVGVRLTRGARAEGSVVRSLTTVSDGLLRRPWTGGSGTVFLDILDDASWRVDATTFAVTVRSATEATRPWRMAFSAMRRDHVAVQTGYSEFLDVEQLPVSVRTQSGSPLDELVSVPYTYADTNGDGIISPGEITVGNALEVVGHTEPRTILTFDGDIEPWRGVRIGTVIEARLGQRAYDGFAVERCRARNCATLYDSTASLARQAAAVASARGIATDFIEDASFARIRELYVEAAPTLLRGARVRLAVHQMLAWTAFGGGDPEARQRHGTVGVGDMRGSQPLYPSVSLRIDVDR